MPPPCYRVCYWTGTRWRPAVTRTRNPGPVVKSLRSRGWSVLVQVRPGKGIPFPIPKEKEQGLKLYA